VETGLTLLAYAKMPLCFWDHAFLTATYLINRLPSPVLGNKSPFFILHLQLPDYKFLKCFGCACFPFTRPYNNHKLEFRSKECIFIGYSSTHKGYKCLDPTGRVFISKDVIFNEYKFPYAELFSGAVPSETQGVSPTLTTFLPTMMSPSTSSPTANFQSPSNVTIPSSGSYTQSSPSSSNHSAPYQQHQNFVTPPHSHNS